MAGGHDGAGMMRWLLTYADLITLLMAFFMVLYAVSRVDVQKYEALRGSLQAVLTGGPGVLDHMAPIEPAIPPEAWDISDVDMAAELVKALAGNDYQQHVRVTVTERGVIVSLFGPFLFPSGGAALTPEATSILAALAPLLLKSGRPLWVEGHADDRPIRTSRYPSNWQLSADRAVQVALYLAETGGISPRFLAATGFGEYRPIAANDTAEHRALNRRVDILIANHSLDPGREPSQP